MRIAAAAFLLLVPRLALAEYAPADVEEVPIARIAENLERTLKADPQDRTALLNLARLNASFDPKRESLGQCALDHVTRAVVDELCN